MVEWLAGNRIRGTSTERTTTTVSTPPTISTDGNYTVLKYTEDGVFIPKGSFNVEYLVIGGGGGGFTNSTAVGSGGGAGALRTNLSGATNGGGASLDSTYGVTAQNYTVTVGAGGAVNTQGGDSSIVPTSGTTITSNGGAEGVTLQTNGATNGNASGSGAGTGYTVPKTGGAGGTYGNNGGNTINSYWYSAGGGGGSGGIGGNSSGGVTAGDGDASAVGGNGGIGLSSSITGTATYYAGGGGGGTYQTGTGGSGGSGVGGQGGGTTNGTANGTTGTANTGSGGGGGTYGGNGATGGSGVVIIRFLTSGNDYLITAEIFMPSLQSPSVYGWKELARHTRTTQGIMDVSSIPLSRYYMVLTNVNDTGGAGGNYRMYCNNDSTASCAGRLAQNGTEYTEISKTNGNYWGGNNIDEGFGVTYWANLAGKEKLGISHFVDRNAVGAGAAPMRSEAVLKWDDVSTAINRFNSPPSWNLWDSGSEMIVLGWDPEDTHTTNFWEELATDTGDGASTDITCTFTAKKYLWIQAWIEGSSSANQTFRLGSSSTPDTGSNYSRRRSNNGGSDTTLTSQDNLLSTWNDATNHQFWNIFIVNNASNEKLCIMHSMNMGGATGAGTAPARYEWVNKWTNTSNQADIFEVNRASGNWSTNSIVKVWGSN